MYIIGSSQTKFGVSDQTLYDLMYQAIKGSLEDAQLDINDIKACVISNNLATLSEDQNHISALIPALSGLDNIPVYNVEAACGAGGVGFSKACKLLEKFDPILIIGAEKMSSHLTGDMLYFVASDSDKELEQREGLLFPAAGALVADMYMRRHKIDYSTLNIISHKNHENGALNKYAHFYGKDIPMELIEKSPILCEPIRLFDCSANSDGAVGIIISKKNTKNSVRVLASEAFTSQLPVFGPSDPLEFSQIRFATEHTLKNANCKLYDIDLFEIHDGFSIMEIIISENMGIFEHGKAQDYIKDGQTRRNGKYPINTTGGLKACGHPLGATGLRQIHDLRRQLLGKAEDNQLERNIKTGLAFNFGSIFKSIAITILEGRG